MIKKILLSLTLVFGFATCAMPNIAPALGLVDRNVALAADGVKANISTDTSTIEKTVDTAGGKLIKMLRSFGIAIVAVLFAFMGYSLWIKKSAESLADLKGRLVGVVLALIFVFFTEQIVGALLGILGYNIGA